MDYMHYEHRTSLPYAALKSIKQKVQIPHGKQDGSQYSLQEGTY